ncbi:hypothetical protein CYMTET_56874 [Cymbomonas tetramitiformis]|uniref:PiggyBac transposable element-derived protein domain-containing protein n=1 Tax=Cymbomonas tetramitiformis TaxID=36881 RepID=A0AAE0BBU2_9CHLO|nr:hypothetical protein CYMTET_56874 [Cymbomonas tetramitiformis]
MGVTINKLCDREGYCYTWEEEHSEGDNSTAGIWRRLTRPLIDDGYKGLIGTVDSRFLSLDIVEELKLKADFRTCSTLDASRVGMPSAEINALDTNLTWGEYSFLYKNGCQILCWAEHNVGHILQNAFPTEWIGHVTRIYTQCKGSQVWMEVLYAVQHYNSEYLGTDTNNQRMKNNSSTKGRRYRRHPTKHFLFAANMNSNGGHLQCQAECEKHSSKIPSKSEYLMAVCLGYKKQLSVSGVNFGKYEVSDLEQCEVSDLEEYEEDGSEDKEGSDPGACETGGEQEADMATSADECLAVGDANIPRIDGHFPEKFVTKGFDLLNKTALPLASDIDIAEDALLEVPEASDTAPEHSQLARRKLQRVNGLLVKVGEHELKLCFVDSRTCYHCIDGGRQQVQTACVKCIEEKRPRSIMCSDCFVKAHANEIAEALS